MVNPLISETRKIGDGNNPLLITDYILSVDTSVGTCNAILPRQDKLAESSRSSGNLSKLGSYTIYDSTGQANINPIKISAPDGLSINGQDSIWLTVPFARIDVSFDGVSYSAITYGNNELDFIISKEKLATMDIAHPVMLLKNPDPNQYLKIDYAALAVLVGSDVSYNGTALRFGYKSIGGRYYKYYW